MRKKYLSSLFAIIMVAMLSLSLTSCSDDDDNDSVENVKKDSSDNVSVKDLTGTLWQGAVEDAGTDGFLTLNFTTSVYGSWSWKFYHSDGTTTTPAGAFVYFIHENNDGSLTLRSGALEGYYTFLIEDSKMKIFFNDNYVGYLTKQ